MTFVSELEPNALWKHFDRILAIPRPSKQEDRMRAHVEEVAARHDLETAVDDAGNLVVYKPARPGAEGAPAVVLQAHLDMVCEKNSDVAFDFERDAIRPVREGEYLTADGTTLGSDNGIGVAAMLALLEADDVLHGPLELLFTIDEETGLTGAAELSGDLLGGRRLLNLDGEEEGSLFVGCAGGVNTRVALPVERAAVPEGWTGLEVTVSGFKGGHSGVDIHLQRGNAIQALARAVHAAALDRELRLASFAGGSAHNAIPREAEAVVVCPAGSAEDVERALGDELAAVLSEYRAAEPDATSAVRGIEAPGDAWDAASSARILELLVALPHGVLSMSSDIPELVETSANLATVAADDGSIEALVSIRSSVDSAKRAQARRVRALADLAGGSAEDEGDYPGWKPDMSSEVLSVVKEVHQRVLGREPEVKAIHAGLETGIIGEKYEGMDMISFGPQIEYPHSPDERVEIGSVERFWRLLTAVIEELAKREGG